MADDEVEGVTNPAFDSSGDPPSANGSLSKSRPVGVVRPSQSVRVAPSDMEQKTDDEERSTCGWGRCRPRFIQCCNNSVGFLFFSSIFAFVQGMTVNGLVYVVTTTLERRFNIPSVRSGFISSCYDFGVLIVVAFVTYLGEKAHKPVWLGLGALVFSVGSVLFTVPHFTTGLYTFYATEVPTCSLNGSSDGGSAELEAGLSRYFAVFIVAQLIHGMSASSIYTLGYTYLDENAPVKWSSIFIGIFQASSLLGPACGYLVGGITLDIYTDIQVDVSTLDIDSASPLWIGAWWIGFLLTASLAFLVAFPLLAFPRSLPGGKQAKQRPSEAQEGTEFTRRPGAKNMIRDFPKALGCLLRNAPFMLISVGAVMEWFILSSIATFGPKYLETQFSMTASDAALLSGYIIIPAGLVGTVVGGVVVSKFKLRFRGMIRFTVVCLVISMLCIPSFLITCEPPKMAGVTVEYTNTSLLFEGSVPNLDSPCNTDCSCGTAFDPVCGSNNVLYYTPCHAACETINTTSETKSYSNCSCIDTGPDGVPTSAVSGKCAETCNTQIIFIIVFFVLLFFTLMATVPVTVATMRCVSHDQRTFALGVQSVMFRAFGTIPSPVVYGALIDQSCILWETDDSGGRQCWQYDNIAFSMTSFILIIVLRCCALVFLIACLCVYKPGPAGDGELEKQADGAENGTGTVNATNDDTKL